MESYEQDNLLCSSSTWSICRYSCHATKPFQCAIFVFFPFKLLNKCHFTFYALFSFPTWWQLWSCENPCKDVPPKKVGCRPCPDNGRGLGDGPITLSGLRIWSMWLQSHVSRATWKRSCVTAWAQARVGQKENGPPDTRTSSPGGERASWNQTSPFSTT